MPKWGETQVLLQVFLSGDLQWSDLSTYTNWQVVLLWQSFMASFSSLRQAELGSPTVAKRRHQEMCLYWEPKGIWSFIY